MTSFKFAAAAVLFGATVGQSATAMASASAPASRPNVLFIVVDDLSPAFEQYGHPAITPNLGRLAAQGTQMQRAFVSIAVCAPSRTAFLTGLRPDTTQVWTIGPYFRNAARGEGMQVVTLPQLFRQHGYNTTGAGKIFHPGTPSGGLSSSEGGGDQCPGQSAINNCTSGPGPDQVGSWSEPYWFCDQYTNDTVQSPAMQQWPCSQRGAAPDPAHVFEWPSCGGGCVQNATCIACFEQCGTWGKPGVWDACDCPDACYPEGVIATQTIRILEQKAAEKAADAASAPWFHAMGFKRPHLTYRAPAKYFELYDLDRIPLPVHRFPSPNAPPISYSHSCVQNDPHVSPPNGSAESYGGGGGGGYVYDAVLYESMGGSIYPAAAGKEKGVCDFYISNRSTPDGVKPSYIEITTDDAAVRDLRRAYYASISLMDAQLGRVLDTMESTGLMENTVITFIGDHGYQNGEKGEWCKSNNFELATRIPMYVVVPDSLGPGWARGVKSSTVVESIDLMVTLADLAGLKLPKQALGGETLRPLLLAAGSAELAVVTPRRKNWALSQWPRRPSCTTHHNCIDGHDDPFKLIPDQAIMGYKLRTAEWAYTVWFEFDWGQGNDPTGAASRPVITNVTAVELYDHHGDDGTIASSERFEFENLAYNASYATLINEPGGLHDQLLAAMATGLKKPILV